MPAKPRPRSAISVDELASLLCRHVKKKQWIKYTMNMGGPVDLDMLKVHALFLKQFKEALKHTTVEAAFSSVADSKSSWGLNESQAKDWVISSTWRFRVMHSHWLEAVRRKAKWVQPFFRDHVETSQPQEKARNDDMAVEDSPAKQQTKKDDVAREEDNQSQEEAEKDDEAMEVDNQSQEEAEKDDEAMAEECPDEMFFGWCPEQCKAWRCSAKNPSKREFADRIYVREGSQDEDFTWCDFQGQCVELAEMTVKDFKAMFGGTTGKKQEQKDGIECKTAVKPMAPLSMRRMKMSVKQSERFFEGESKSFEKVVVRFRGDRPCKDLIAMIVDSRQVCSVPIALFASKGQAVEFLTTIAQEYVKDRVLKKELYSLRDDRLRALSLEPPRKAMKAKMEKKGKKFVDPAVQKDEKEEEKEDDNKKDETVVIKRRAAMRQKTTVASASAPTVASASDPTSVSASASTVASASAPTVASAE